MDAQGPVPERARVSPTRRDASGVDVAVPRDPARIVSLVPSVTELLFLLGLEGRIAGITVF